MIEVGLVFVVQDQVNARPGIDLVSLPQWNGVFVFCKEEHAGVKHGDYGATVVCHKSDHPSAGMSARLLLDRIQQLEAAVELLAARVRTEVVDVDGGSIELRPTVLRESVPDQYQNGIQPSVVAPINASAMSGSPPVQNPMHSTCVGYSSSKVEASQFLGKLGSKIQ